MTTAHKLVPVEPTEAMLDAWLDVENNTTAEAWRDQSREIYAAMLAAAPVAPAADASEAVREDRASQCGSKAGEKAGPMRAAVEAVASAMLQGGDGAVGDFGWNIGALNKARPLIRAALRNATPPAPVATGGGELVAAAARLSEWVEWHDCPHSSDEEAPPIDEDDVRMLIAALSPAPVVSEVRAREVLARIFSEAGFVASPGSLSHTIALRAMLAFARDLTPGGEVSRHG